MLRTRLWMGTFLVGLAAGVVVVDQWLSPWFPFLFVLLLGLSLAACFELVQLLGSSRVHPGLCYSGVALLTAANWLAHVPGPGQLEPQPWTWIAAVFALLVMAPFLVEMARFRETGGAVSRIALTIWIIAYLGLLPCFLAQLRWLGGSEVEKGTTALALAIFVPKVCDMGAYFTGRFLGRHKMAPVLSPKKTWEGAAGGLAAAVVTAVALDLFLPVSLLHQEPVLEIGFGLALGAASMLGDLAESLIKRDSGQKDASRVLPGFGGVLDVVDSVIFPAPLAYWCLNRISG